MSLIDRVLPHRRRLLRAQFLKALLQDVTDESRRNAHSDFQSSVDEVGARIAELRDLINDAQCRTQSDLDARFSVLRQELTADFERKFELAHDKTNSGLGGAQARLEQFAERFAVQFDGLAESTDRVVRLKGDIVAQLGFFIRDIELLLSATAERLAATANGDLHRGFAVLKRDLLAELEQKLELSYDKMKSELGEFTERVVRHENDLAAQISVAQHGLDQTLALLAKINVEHWNKLVHLDTSLNSRLNTLEGATQRGLDEALSLLTKINAEHWNKLAHLDSSLHSRLNTLQSELLPEIVEQVHQTAAAQLSAKARTADHRRWAVQPLEQYQPAQPEPFEATLCRAAKDYPKVYQDWWNRLDATRKAFEQTKVGNAANRADLYSRMFTDFLLSHAEGRILDVGCGPFGRPVYLADYPTDLVSGLEPLPMVEPPDFECVAGISEYLPWPDRSFSTVVSATSLDHCLSLDRSIEEMKRVLVPGGTAVFWIGSTKGAKPYAPESPDFVPADKYHLFHFDAVWFEPILERSFDIVDRMEFAKTGYSHVFYALRLRR